MKILGKDFSDRSSPESSKLWSEHMMFELEHHLPRMRLQSSKRDFWKWFRGETESLYQQIPSEADRSRARHRVNGLLRSCQRNPMYWAKLSVQASDA